MEIDQNMLDTIHVMLVADDLKQKGFLEGGPNINRAKMEAYIAEAKAQGFTPSRDAAQRVFPAIQRALKQGATDAV